MYKDLIVWQKSYEFTLEIYKVTKDYPNDEKFGLVSQMRRAASSIPANIAEGNMRKSPNEYKQFLYIASVSFLLMIDFAVYFLRITCQGFDKVILVL